MRGTMLLAAGLAAGAAAAYNLIKQRRRLSSAERRRVVIVGAQFAGAKAAAILRAAGLDVTLIDNKDYFEFTPSVLRALVQPEHAERIVLPHLPGVTLATVVAIHVNPGGAAGGAVELADGSRLPYDYLLLTTGSNYVAPIRPQLDAPESAAASKAAANGTCGTTAAAAAAAATAACISSKEGSREARIAALRAAAAQLSAAASVLIVGGGSVGVELAAEIVGKFGRQKAVTVVTSQERLLERMPAKAGAHAAGWLAQRGVTLVYNERASRMAPAAGGSKAVVETAGGAVLEADLLYDCTGAPANCQLWRQLLGAVAAHADGSDGAPPAGGRLNGIAVTASLQVGGFPCILAAGDAMHSAFEKTALTADASGAMAARNIVRLASCAGGPLLAFPRDACAGAAAPPAVACISLYNEDGVMQFNSIVQTGAAPRAMKAMVEAWQLALLRGGTGLKARLLRAAWEANERFTLLAGAYLP